MSECESSLSEVDNSGLYALKTIHDSVRSTLFMITGEVDAEFRVKDQSKRVHLLVFCPNIEVAKQVTNLVSRYGDLNSDGRPKLHVTPPELTEVVTEVDPWNEVIPAHVWTPFFSLFGSRSGFNRIEDCFQDQTGKIHAIETGLSSDPRMNWRISDLDRLTLVSNSDSHSPWPYRIGREANVFELKQISYKEIIDAIRRKDRTKFLETIETDPCYGKYHYTGHRICNVSLDPKGSAKCGRICPVCGKKLTVGVLDRVEELADRKDGFKPEGAIPFVSLIPLQEVISIALGVRDVFAKVVWEEYGKLTKRFPNELYILLEAPRGEISSVSGERISDAILKVREKRISFKPGYDGLYGHPVIFEDEPSQESHIADIKEENKESGNAGMQVIRQKERRSAQKSLSDYF